MKELTFAEWKRQLMSKLHIKDWQYVPNEATLQHWYEEIRAMPFDDPLKPSDVYLGFLGVMAIKGRCVLQPA